MSDPKPPVADAPPWSDGLTAYDRAHLTLYARLLDAERASASLSEVASLLFGIDAAAEPERAARVRDSHLRRARWMTDQGYRAMLKDGDR